MKRLYSLLLRLFPKSYRNEYGDELQAVFNLALDAANKSGRGEAARLVLRELISFPGAAIYQHMRERRTQMSGTFASRFDFTPGTRYEILAAMSPFLFLGALPLLSSILERFIAIPLWLQIALRLCLVLFVLSLFMIGLVTGLPRWSLPYLGLPLPVISILLMAVLPEFPALFWRRLYDISWFSGAFVFGGLILMGVPLSVILLVLMTRVIKKFSPFYQRLQEDWTLLCFLLYGSIPFLLVILFEGFKNEELYLIFAFLALAVGAWLYLRNDHPRKKFLSLFGGMTFSMFITILGQEALYQSSFWSGSPSWTTTMSTVIYWVWLTLFMLLSSLIHIFPKFRRNSPAG